MTNTEYLRKFNSTDYSFNKGESVERFLTKRTLETKHTYTSKETYLRKTTNKFGTFLPGDHKIKEAFDTEEIFKDILQCWEAITNYEKKDVLQVSSGLNHYVRNICIVDVDANNWNMWFTTNVISLNPTYIVKTESGHLQIGWLYTKAVSSKENTKTFLLGNKAIRYLAAKENLLKDGQKYGDDNYTGWQCKNPFSKRVEHIYFNENNVVECSDLQSMFSSWIQTAQAKFPSVDVEVANKRLNSCYSNIITPFSSSLYNSNKSYSCPEQSRTVILYNKLRTAITQIKNSKAKRNQEPTCSYEEALKAAMIIAKDNQLDKGMLPQTEIEATTRCTLKWVNEHWKPFEKDSARSSANMKKIAEFEKQIKDMDFIILHGKIVEETERRKKLGLSCSTRSVAEALGITPQTVSRHNRKTEAELLAYEQSANKLAARVADSSSNSELVAKYSSKVVQYNRVIQIYNSSFLSSLYNSNKSYSCNSTEDTTTSTTQSTYSEDSKLTTIEEIDYGKQNKRTEACCKGKISCTKEQSNRDVEVIKP